MGSMFAARFAGRRHATVAHTRRSSLAQASIHGLLRAHGQDSGLLRSPLIITGGGKQLTIFSMR
jgi:hypothetical protein